MSGKSTVALHFITALLIIFFITLGINSIMVFFQKLFGDSDKNFYQFVSFFLAYVVFAVLYTKFLEYQNIRKTLQYCLALDRKLLQKIKDANINTFNEDLDLPALLFLHYKGIYSYNLLPYASREKSNIEAYDYSTLSDIDDIFLASVDENLKNYYGLYVQSIRIKLLQYVYNCPLEEGAVPQIKKLQNNGVVKEFQREILEICSLKKNKTYEKERLQKIIENLKYRSADILKKYFDSLSNPNEIRFE